MMVRPDKAEVGKSRGHHTLGIKEAAVSFSCPPPLSSPRSAPERTCLSPAARSLSLGGQGGREHGPSSGLIPSKPRIPAVAEQRPLVLAVPGSDIDLVSYPGNGGFHLGETSK